MVNINVPGAFKETEYTCTCVSIPSEAFRNIYNTQPSSVSLFYLFTVVTTVSSINLNLFYPGTGKSEARLYYGILATVNSVHFHRHSPVSVSSLTICNFSQTSKSFFPRIHFKHDFELQFYV